MKAPKEPSVIPGSFASPKAIAHIMMQKFVMSSLLYRQELEWAQLGLKLSRQTMSNWVLRTTEEHLLPGNIQVGLAAELTPGESSTRHSIALPPDKREGLAALTGLEYCNQLFA